MAHELAITGTGAQGVALADVAPVRTKVVSARSPKQSEMASMSRDFPAPVSPVIAVNPGPNVTSARSMMAIFSAKSSMSILKLRRTGGGGGSSDNVGHSEFAHEAHFLA